MIKTEGIVQTLEGNQNERSCNVIVQTSEATHGIQFTGQDLGKCSQEYAAFIQDSVHQDVEQFGVEQSTVLKPAAVPELTEESFVLIEKDGNTVSSDLQWGFCYTCTGCSEKFASETEFLNHVRLFHCEVALLPFNELPRNKLVNQPPIPSSVRYQRFKLQHSVLLDPSEEDFGLQSVEKLSQENVDHEYVGKDDSLGESLLTLGDISARCGYPISREQVNVGLLKKAHEMGRKKRVANRYRHTIPVRSGNKMCSAPATHVELVKTAEDTSGNAPTQLLSNSELPTYVLPMTKQLLILGKEKTDATVSSDEKQSRRIASPGLQSRIFLVRKETGDKSAFLGGAAAVGPSANTRGFRNKRPVRSQHYSKQGSASPDSGAEGPDLNVKLTEVKVEPNAKSLKSEYVLSSGVEQPISKQTLGLEVEQPTGERVFNTQDEQLNSEHGNHFLARATNEDENEEEEITNVAATARNGDEPGVASSCLTVSSDTTTDLTSSVATSGAIMQPSKTKLQPLLLPLVLKAATTVSTSDANTSTSAKAKTDAAASSNASDPVVTVSQTQSDPVVTSKVASKPVSFVLPKGFKYLGYALPVTELTGNRKVGTGKATSNGVVCQLPEENAQSDPANGNNVTGADNTSLCNSNEVNEEEILINKSADKNLTGLVTKNCAVEVKIAGVNCEPSRDGTRNQQKIDIGEILGDRLNRSSPQAHSGAFTKNRIKVKWRCEICELALKNKCEYDMHLCQHAGKNLFSCEVCGASFPSEAQTRRHCRTKHGLTPYKCNQCGRNCRNRKDMRVHLMRHAGIKRFFCQTCGKGFVLRSQLQRHEKTHVETKTVPCDICKKMYVDEKTVLLHQRKVHGSSTYTCEDCGKVCQSIGNLKTHRAFKHSSVRSFMCGVCGKAFVREPDLNRHVQTHTGLKPYACDQCENAYANRSALRRHLIAHSGLKPYQCTYCDLKVRDMSSLRRHVRCKHLQEKRYACGVCNELFFRKEQMKKHELKHEDEEMVPAVSQLEIVMTS